MAGSDACHFFVLQRSEKEWPALAPHITWGERVIFLRVELPCQSGGVPLGRVEYEDKGPRLSFACRLPISAEVCKLWLVRGERRLLLGTPAPEGEELTLRRTFSRAMLSEQGVYPPERVEVTGSWAAGGGPEQEQWQTGGAGVARLSDPLLRQMFSQGGWGWRRWERGTVFCHSWEENAPFPAVPLFCLAQVERREHKIQVRIYLDQGGNPCFPP